MTVVAWDVASMQRIATCVGHNAGVKSISVHEKGDVVASGAYCCMARHCCASCLVHGMMQSYKPHAPPSACMRLCV